MKNTIDLRDTDLLHILSEGLYAKLDELSRENLDGASDRDKAFNTVRKWEQYVALAKINVQRETAALMNWSWTSLETKLAKAKIASAKVEVELAAERLGQANADWRETSRVIVID